MLSPDNIDAFARITILPFDEAAARAFENLQRHRLRVGTMDLKIAAICLTHEALLLTRNLRILKESPACAQRIGSIEAEVTPETLRGRL